MYSSSSRATKHTKKCQQHSKKKKKINHNYCTVSTIIRDPISNLERCTFFTSAVSPVVLQDCLHCDWTRSIGKKKNARTITKTNHPSRQKSQPGEAARGPGSAPPQRRTAFWQGRALPSYLPTPRTPSQFNGRQRLFRM